MRVGFSNGFSLVELLIVIALVGIIMAIGTPAVVSQITHLRLNRSVRDIATEIQAARLKAIAQNTRMRVDFTGGSYNLAIFSGGAWADYPSRAAGQLASGIAVTSPAGDFSIEFFPNGSATSTVICVNNTTKANDRKSISVTGATGMITVNNGC